MRRNTFNRAVALVAPPLCAACRTQCAPGEWICTGCRAELARLPRRGGAAYPYVGRARDLVAALKFDGRVALAREMAALIAERVPDRLGGAEWIVPVPAHPGRARRRGFNQSELLARELARIVGARCVDCLVREAGTRPQSELSRAERLALPRSAFRAHSLAEFPTNVVLCDDVSTTGVTLEACVQAIRERLPQTGSRQIRAVTFASTPTYGTTDRIARRQSRRTPG